MNQPLVEARPWESFIPPAELAIYNAAGYGARQQLGSRLAILVIDVTYNFCGDHREPIETSVLRYRNSCGDHAWDAIERMQTLLPAARAAGVPVLYTHSRSFSRTGDKGGWQRKNSRAAEDAQVGPHGNTIVKEIEPQPEDYVFEKEKPSGFFGSALMSRLVNLGVDTVLVTGGTTSGCVRATVIDAFSYDLRVAVVHDATFDRGATSHAVNLFDMAAKYASCISTETAIDYIRNPAGESEV
ncbi:MAG: N-carbamoylsarcosine amidase [Rhodoglobus sp.]|nr:N-carbamoylsarcosine amidase [Rhodoglobus sp.]